MSSLPLGETVLVGHRLQERDLHRAEERHRVEGSVEGDGWEQVNGNARADGEGERGRGKGEWGSSPSSTSSCFSILLSGPSLSLPVLPLPPSSLLSSVSLPFSIPTTFHVHP
eukprot:1106229-Rhodomonas_salina.4